VIFFIFEEKSLQIRQEQVIAGTSEELRRIKLQDNCLVVFRVDRDVAGVNTFFLIETG